MNIQLGNLMQALPVLHELNESGVLTKTEYDFKKFSSNERSQSEIHWLIDPKESGGAGAAIVKYAAGSKTPLHLHSGFELALVLEGEMITDQGTVKKNEMILLRPGSQHESHSETGALVLIIWEKPVVNITA